MKADEHVPLTASQSGRIEFAHRDLDEARAADLAELPPTALILQVERLRNRLDDMLALIKEMRC